MTKEVSILDFIAPEFRGADPLDYEFRNDGKIVRKDRWMNGMNSIAQAIGMSTREGYEIPDAVNRVEQVFTALENIDHRYILNVLERVGTFVKIGSYSREEVLELQRSVKDSIEIVRNASDALEEKESYEPNPT